MKLRTVQMIILLLAMFLPGLLQGQKTNTEQESNPRPCNLKVSNSPSIRGLRLGMTTDQLLDLFPGSRENPKVQSDLTPYYGRARIDFSYFDYPSPRFKNVSGVNVVLFDGTVTEVYVSYQGPPWNSVDEMITKVAGALSLPSAENWKSGGDHAKALKCDGFDMKVTAYQGGTCCSSIHLEIPNIFQKVNDRKAAAEEKARKEFTP